MHSRAIGEAKDFLMSQSNSDSAERDTSLVTVIIERLLFRRRMKADQDGQRRRKGFSRSTQNKLAALLVFAVIASGIATYAALTETPPLGNDPDTVIWLLNLDFILLLMLVALIARRLVALWSGRKRGLAGSHMHVRLVYTFSILAAAPAIIMTVFSALFFHYGVQTWFSDRVQTAIHDSQAVATAYLEEHRQVIRADVLAMAHDIDRQASFFLSNEDALEKAVQTQSLLRNFSEAIIFDSSGRLLARSGLTLSLEFEEVPDILLRKAAEGDVVITTGGNDDRVRALIKLNNLSNTFLFVGRMVDPKVLSHVIATREAADDYANLQSRYSSLQIVVVLIFVVVGLLLMLVAIWFGLMLARQLVSPISALIKTADRVRGGDLAARVPDPGGLEEFSYLATSFNRMTKQIQEQQGELIEANRQLDQRRRLIETVLEGVTSGIVGVDQDGAVNLANSSSCQLLGVEEGEFVGTKITDIMPEVAALLDQAHDRPEKITQADIQVLTKEGRKRTFLVRISIQLIGDQDMGAIMTFDDITELQSAQRKAAWSDVARRIAHEIKNPLTPIQLSAERLRRKYMDQIKDDPETFAQCTETIIRHVGDIGHMVNEFSSFARMPEPNLVEDHLAKYVDDALFLHKQAHPDIAFTFIDNSKKTSKVAFDAQQVRQALNNLLQNAADSIEMKLDGVKAKSKEKAGRIDVLLAPYGRDELALIVTDNGLGLPESENPVHLTEPYVTHKPKGTGLGLAIVKKIMEDHNGSLVVGAPGWLQKLNGWSDLGGATMALVFPLEKGQKKKTSRAKA